MNKSARISTMTFSLKCVGWSMRGLIIIAVYTVLQRKLDRCEAFCEILREFKGIVPSGKFTEFIIYDSGMLYCTTL